MPGPDPDVVDFIFEQGRAATERQLRDADALDSKATQVFGAATVIIGLSSFSRHPNAALFTAAVAAYLAAAFVTVWSLWLAKFRVTDAPDQLLRFYWNMPLDETKYAMVTDMAAGFEENERELGRKRRGVLAVLTLAGVETALVGIAVIWSLWA